MRAAEGPQWDARTGKPLVVVILDPDEAENLGYALGPHDAGGQQLIEWADEARQMAHGDNAEEGDGR